MKRLCVCAGCNWSNMRACCVLGCLIVASCVICSCSFMLPASAPSRAHSSHLMHSRVAHWRLLTVADDSVADDGTAASTENDATNEALSGNATASENSATVSSFVDVVDVEAVKRAAAATAQAGAELVKQTLKERWRQALHKIKTEPVKVLTIPLTAAFVGWFTNKIGIVPAKAAVMSARMTDMVTSQLVDVEQ
eukprot:18878-Heterococcus_DN1.PRE.1